MSFPASAGSTQFGAAETARQQRLHPRQIAPRTPSKLSPGRGSLAASTPLAPRPPATTLDQLEHHGSSPLNTPQPETPRSACRWHSHHRRVGFQIGVAQGSDRLVALLIFCFSSFALSAGAVFLCCFAVAAGGVMMCCRVTVAMLDGQIVQSSGLLVQVGGGLKGGSGTMLCFPGPFVCFAGSASGKPHVFGVEGLTCLKLGFSPLKFCCPVGCMRAKCFSVTPIGCIHNPYVALSCRMAAARWRVCSATRRACWA